MMIVNMILLLFLRKNITIVNLKINDKIILGILSA